ncbi:hypothetical protein M758_10G144900 [Ceratodon purpureus]|nr:hypothetical protein M758_10G144900 [Ceratodon purpureus]
MGLPTGHKACLWWILSSVVVVVVVTATVDNKPADGYLHSGYFWPKTICWQSIRHAPGLYWLVFVIYLLAVLNSLYGIIRSMCVRRNCGCKRIDGIFSFGTTMMGVGLLFISVAAANLSDVVQGYFIGMCMIQVTIDALRGIIRCKPKNFFVVVCALLSFQISAAFGIAMLDSYRPLNQLNCAYFFIGILIVTPFVTLASVYENYKVAGFIGALLQVVFCGLSYRIANQVADVNKEQNIAFLATAVINFLLVNIAKIVLP